MAPPVENLTTATSSTTQATESRSLISGLKPPSKLCLSTNIQEAWKLFKQRWISYAVLSCLSSMPTAVQVALFLHCLDDDALRIYNGFTFDTEENNRTVDEIVTKFEAFAVGEVNITYERFLFNNRAQKDKEPFVQFLSDTRRLIKTCDYCANCVDSVLKDILVLGIYNKETQRDLLKARDLTLKSCIDICNAADNADKHRNTYSSVTLPSDSSSTASASASAPQETVVNSFKGQHAKKTSYLPRRHYQNDSTSSYAPPPVAVCKYCARAHVMMKKECPAYGRQCKTCGQLNHSHLVCEGFQKRVSNVVDDDCYSDSEWVNAFDTHKLSRCKLILRNHSVPFLIDTGSTVNVLPAKYCNTAKLTLSPSRVRLLNNSTVATIGTSLEEVFNPKTRVYSQILFTIVDNSTITPIIGIKTAEKMRFVVIERDNFIPFHESQVTTKNNLISKIPKAITPRVRTQPSQRHKSNSRIPVIIQQ